MKHLQKIHLKIIEGKTNFINLDSNLTILPHIKGIFDYLTFDNDATKNALAQTYNCFFNFSQKDEQSFIRIHLPHVLAGRDAYSSDIDLFDIVVEDDKEWFGDDSIFISTDHGNMDMKMGNLAMALT